MFLFLVDAFSRGNFSGNPAGIALVENFPSKIEMQNLARYWNFPDFAFLKKIDEKNYEIKWFAPLDESPICIHGTLAASHIIFENKISNCNKIHFLNNDIKIKASKFDSEITLSLKKIKIEESKKNLDSKKLFGIKKVEKILEEKNSYIIILEKYEDVFNATPNFEEIKKLDKRSVIITAPGFDNFDFCIRYFAPKAGVYEDPVCGSANCKVSSYWTQKLNKNKLTSFQASKRSGIVNLEIKENFVLISGSSITVLKMKNFKNNDLTDIMTKSSDNFLIKKCNKKME